MTIRKLANGRYVAELKCNLISVGQLDRLGYAYKSKNGVLKVTKGSLVKLRGTLGNSLYVMEGTVILGNVATASKQQKQQTIDHVVTEARVDS